MAVEFIEKVKRSKHFKAWKDPESGVVSYVLDSDAVPHTQSFYFTNRSITNDGRYMWVYCAFPPAGDANYGRSLAVVDLDEDTFTHFPETQFLDASPLIDLENGTAYWCNKSGVYRRGPRPEDRTQCVAPLPDFLRGKGALVRIATHMTFSTDKRKVCFDAEVGNHWIMGDLDLASGLYTVWYEFDYARNHAQFNPAEPDLLLFAEDMWTEKQDGKFHDITYDKNGGLARLWTIKKGEEPVYWPPLYTEARHEWWSADGKSIYYVDWNYGAIKIDTVTGKREVADPRGTWHAHCTDDELLFVADENEIDGKKWYRGCKSRVHFYNTKTKKYVNIATENPALYTREEPCRYHIDPHPQFTFGDTVVMYTATVTGRVSAAVTEVAPLLERTR